MPDDTPSHRAGRRRALAGLLAAVGAATRAVAQHDASDAVDVWIELSEPVPAGARDDAQAQQRRLRVAQQQERVAQRLHELGITEKARLVHSRNAILARLTSQQKETVLAVPGVRRLRPAHSLHPPKPMP